MKEQEKTLQYVLKHREGGYLHRTPANDFKRVMQKSQATRFTKEKAENVMKNSISPLFRNLWEIVLDDTPYPLEEQIMGFNWDELSRQQQEMYATMNSYQEQLRNDLSLVDKEICDIQHYIEFFSLDAAKGYKMYRMLKERLIRRRSIKEELAKTHCFVSGNSDDFATGRICQQLQSMNHRMYTPRVLDELFPNGVFSHC